MNQVEKLYQENIRLKRQLFSANRTIEAYRFVSLTGWIAFVIALVFV